MNNINPKFNNQYDYMNAKTSFRSAASIPAESLAQVQIPDLYYVPDKLNNDGGFKENLKKVDIMGLIYPWFEHPLMMLGTCAGISLGVDAFSKSCNKEYEKSILGKAAKLGDKIENSNLIQNDKSQKILGGVGKGWESAKKLFMKSDIIRAMVETPTKPEHSMPKDELLHTENRVVHKFQELVRDLDLLPHVNKDGNALYKDFKLKDFELTKEEIESLKRAFGVDKLANVAEEKVTARFILEKAGCAESEISSILSSPNMQKEMREAVIRKMGTTEAQLETIMKDHVFSDINLIKNLSNNVKDLRINGGKMKIPGNYQPFNNVTSFGEIYNRLHSLSDGAATKTGKFMSRFLQKLHRGFTFGGTKFGVMLFVAPMLVETLLNTKKADNREKAGTFVNGLIRSISWVFVFPVALMSIHALGGIKNAGVSKANVEEISRKIKEFNEKIFDSKESYKEAKKALKSEIKALNSVKEQNLLTRMLRKVSAFLKSDLEKIRPYQSQSGSGFANYLRRLPQGTKNFIWSTGRFMAFMMIFMPFFDKIIEKGVSTVFGHSYDGMKEEEYAEKKKQQEEFSRKDLNTRLYEAQAIKQGVIPPKENTSPFGENPVIQQINAAKAMQETKQNGDTQPNVMQADELLNNDNDKLSQQPIPEKQAEPQQKAAPVEEIKPVPNKELGQKNNNVTKRDNYTYIPSQDCTLTNPALAQVNKYIPAQTAANLTKTFDNSGLEAALRRADRAEIRAIQTLSGKFGNM